MTATRRGVLAALFLLALVMLGWRLLHLYSVPRPYDALIPSTRDFLSRAVALDSAGLMETGASAAAVQWALETARRSPQILRDLLRDLRVLGGRRVGDEMFVLFAGSARGICLNRPLAVTFRGPVTEAQIQTISTDCRAAP